MEAVDARTIADEIRRRLGERVNSSHEVLAEIERIVAERPEVGVLRVAIEYELLSSLWPPSRVARREAARASGDPRCLVDEWPAA